MLAAASANRGKRCPARCRAVHVFLCALLLAKFTEAQSSCPAGQFLNGGACEDCPPHTYSDSAGTQTSCDNCPEGSFAYQPGSTGCLACYFGEPKVLAGSIDGVAALATLPSEQPKPGYKVVTLTSSLSTCSAASPFNACGDTSGSSLAIDTDEACNVRLYLLGNPACSVARNLTTVAGSYRNPTFLTASDGSVLLDLQALTIAFTDGTSTCGSPIALPSSSSCPGGTAADPNPDAADVDVFVASQCSPCNAGYKCPAGGAGPAQCTAGTYNSLVGATDCLECPDLLFSFNGADVCLECDQGTHPTAAKDTCVLCPAGQYLATPGMTCQDCAAGYYRGADADGTSCIKCSPGTYSSPGAAECTPCAPGTAAEDEGTAPDATTGACPRCPAGSFADGYGSYTCNPCPPGAFSSAPGAASCTPCGAGQITVNVDGSGATSCRPCLEGTYKPADSGNNRCSSCPAGYATGASSGASTCTACEKGFYSPRPNTAFCLPCPPSMFAPVTGMRLCQVCSAGFVTGLTPTNAKSGPFLGSTAVAAVRCDPCPFRTFRPSISSGNTCTPCPRGRETKRASAATLCTVCIPGQVLLKTGSQYNAACSPCPAGQFSDKQSTSDACTPCRPGTHVADAGNSVCDVCEPGTYQDEPGTTTCKPCPEGRYNPGLGGASMAACQLAPKGNFASGLGNDGFVPCPAGSFQDRAGEGFCKPCPPGRECPPGATVARQCQPGFFADARQPFCKQCLPGTFQDQAAQRACKPCPRGSYCPSSRMSSPFPCPAGTYGNDLGRVSKADACLPCPVNTRQPLAGQTSCIACVSGKWTNRMTGQTQCWPLSQRLPLLSGR